MKTIHATYESGVFRPTEPVELTEASHVEFEPKLVSADRSVPGLDEVYDVLRKRFASGESDVAARHNGHQP
jgi:predicted DNA-binding antitoxin AbrB/MazE fold protein